MGDIAITKLTENLVNCWVGDTTIVDGVKIPTENWGGHLEAILRYQTMWGFTPVATWSGGRSLEITIGSQHAGFVQQRSTPRFIVFESRERW